jgi:hypothetical protein
MKHSSLFDRSVSNKEKVFIIRTSYLNVILTLQARKLECTQKIRPDREGQNMRHSSLFLRSTINKEKSLIH